MVTPSYISYWSALHHYGFTEQVPHTIFVATTRKKRPILFRGQEFRYVAIKPYKFFGYRRERIGELPVLIADEAKALIDSLDQPRYAGGMTEVVRSLAQALPDLDIELLLDYANRMRDRSLNSRLGYLLHNFGYDAPGLAISTTPVLLDPTGTADGVYDKHWHVRNNLSAEELTLEGIG
jgi:predicted transcriptional regulator of viral defense system